MLYSCKISAKPGIGCRRHLLPSRHAQLHIVAEAICGHAKGGPVLILPGFLSGSDPYAGMAVSLRAVGFAAGGFPAAAAAAADGMHVFGFAHALPHSMPQKSCL
jgi:hypothetical protein